MTVGFTNAIKILHTKIMELEDFLMYLVMSQQNNKCWQCGDRDEIINHMISKCSKLAQKDYKTRHNWVGKVIHWEMCKKFKFDHTNKWYMHNPAPVLKNDTQTPMGL